MPQTATKMKGNASGVRIINRKFYPNKDKKDFLLVPGEEVIKEKWKEFAKHRPAIDTTPSMLARSMPQWVAAVQYMLPRFLEIVHNRGWDVTVPQPKEAAHPTLPGRSIMENFKSFIEDNRYTALYNYLCNVEKVMSGDHGLSKSQEFDIVCSLLDWYEEYRKSTEEDGKKTTGENNCPICSGSWDKEKPLCKVHKSSSVLKDRNKQKMWVPSYDPQSSRHPAPMEGDDVRLGAGDWLRVKGWDKDNNLVLFNPKSQASAPSFKARLDQITEIYYTPPGSFLSRR